MSLLQILHFPDPRLRNVGAKVENFDARLQKIIDDMIETMYHAHGVGLAATQVSIALQLSVIDISEHRDDVLVMLNPEIQFLGEPYLEQEGCLSVPGHYDKVMRYPRVHLKAQDRDGSFYEFETDGLLAHCIQHEYDHLQGKLYIDYLSGLKRERIRAKLEKNKRYS